MKCSEVKRKLSAYLDGEVSGADKKEIAEHLTTCEDCQEELTALSSVSDALVVLGGIEVPPYFMTRVRQCINDEANATPFLGRIRSIAVTAATAIAVIVSLFIGNQFGRTLYQSITGNGTPATAQTSDVFGLGAFEEFPNGSLSDIYNELVAGGNDG